ncbi:MAG TPA: hypothetical protein VI916_09115 [Acidimicrobiia bacterium]|nr:hypothetical protein [Acidimicrobiia bacterium]
MTHLSFRRLTACLCALALALSACGGGGANESRSPDGGANGSGSGAPTGEPGKAGNSAQGGSGAGGPGDGGALGGSNEESAPPKFDLSRPIRRSDVPKEGRYTYDYTEVASGSSTRTYDVGDHSSDTGWLRQLTSYYSGSEATRALVVWLADRYYEEVEQRAREDQVGAVCVWDPGYLLLKLPLTVGDSWEADSECDTEAAHRRRTEDAEVTGTRRVDVGGRLVDGYVITRTTTTTTKVKTVTPVVLVEVASTEDVVSVERKMLLESSGTRAATIDGAPQGIPEQFTLRLRSIEPEPPS